MILLSSVTLSIIMWQRIKFQIQKEADTMSQIAVESKSEHELGWTQGSSSLRVKASGLGHNNKNQLSACAEPVFAESKFCFVSMVSTRPNLYGLSAVKLGISIRKWTNIDMIMLMLNTSQQFPALMNQMKRVGWKICTVPTISGPVNHSQEPNRFLEAKMYSKFNAWNLIEYDAVLMLDADTLVIRDPSQLFQYHFVQMKLQNKSLGAAIDRPTKSTCWLWGNMNYGFNAGVLLLEPCKDMFQFLKYSIGTVSHNTVYAEQGLLNTLFNESFYHLPFIFNGNLISKACEPELWEQISPTLSIVHFTIVKGWMNSLYFDTWEDLAKCWWWDVQEFCELWDIIQ